MIRDDEEHLPYRDQVLDQTQGMVDTKKDYPQLYHYFEQPFMPDQIFWQRAQQLFTPEEWLAYRNRLDSPLKPRVLFFADQSAVSHRIFNNLLEGNISMRVFPVDDNIQEPSIGDTIFRVVFQGEDKIKKFVEIDRESTKRMTESFKRTFPRGFNKPDQSYVGMRNTVRLIQDLLAIREFSAIQGFRQPQ